MSKRSECTVDIWAERDRQSIVVSADDGQTTVAEWWDDDVSGMIEDGFFDASGYFAGREAGRPKLADSVLDYLVEMGVIE